MTDRIPSERIERKLTTILAADVAGSSAHMEADETAALAALREGRGVFRRLIECHGGRIANTAGDGLVADFPSVVEAVRCALEAQDALAGLEARPGVPMRFRIGVHLGDVMVDGDDLLGEGVNLAARLQTMAEPGGVLVSRQVLDQVERKLRVAVEPLGWRRPHNFTGTVEVFRLGPRTAGSTVRGLVPAAGGGRALLLIALGLVVIDASTAGGPWAQFPLLAMGTWALACRAPALAPAWVGFRLARSAALALGLVGLNLLTWNGTLWSAIPAGLLLVWAALQRRRDP